MKSKVEKLAKGKMKIVITVEAEDMAKYYNQSYEKLSPSVKIDGFRPGKAPRKLIEASIGVARILSEGLDLAIQESYLKALLDNKINPITQPKIAINKYPNYTDNSLDIKEPLEFEAELEILPPVKLKDYSKIKVKKTDPKKATEKDIEKVLEHFQKQGAEFKEVSRPAKDGDRVEINFEGSVKGVRIDQMCSKNHPLVLGSKSMIPGFEEEIVGMKKGENKKFKIKFPDDYHAKEHAGKEAEFNVELVDLKEINLPEVDDKFAQKFGHDTAKKLKKAIEDNLNKEYIEENKREIESEVMEKMLPLLDAEIPETLISQESERMFSDFERQLAASGLTVDKYLLSIKKTKEEMLTQMKPQAEKNVKIGLLLGKIIEEKKWDHHNQEAGKKAIEYLVDKLTK